MQCCSGYFRRAMILVCLVLTALILEGAGRSTVAGNIIYFTDVTDRLKLDAQQRAQVQSITKQSVAATLAVFTKYGVDPRATPDPAKLRPARGELEASDRRERSQLKKILDASQMKKYDSIMKQLRARVTRAAMGNMK